MAPYVSLFTLQPIVERIRREIPNLICNAWYLDDGTLCGSPEDLERALEIIEEEGPARGLHLNRHKSLLYIPPGEDLFLNPLPREIPITSSGFCLLRVPLGPDQFREAAVLGRVAKIQSALAKLGDLEDSQMQTTLLRSCLSLPTFKFSIRTCPPSVIK